MKIRLHFNKISLQLFSLTLLMALLFIPISYSQNTVRIGSGAERNIFLPIRSSSSYSYTQQIYSQALINYAGNIEKIRLNCASHLINNSGDWVIYLGHTAKTAFSSNTDWVPVSSMTLVFNGSVTFPASGWTEITLTTPFPYNNINNLVIAVDENTPGNNYNDSEWFSFSSGSTTGISYSDIYNDIDPSSPPAAFTLQSSLNQIELYFGARVPMTFTSSTTTQTNTAEVRAGYTSQVVLGVEVVTAGHTSPLSITGFTFNTLGTTSAGDISNAKVYWTAGSSAFETGTQIGSTVASPSGAFSISGSKTLVAGTNYFWLTYDITSGAPDRNVIDATCDLITVASVNRTPAVTSIAGSRTIRQPFTGTKIIASSGGQFTTLSAAITDLNIAGVGTGGVTFTLADGEIFNETPTIRMSETGTETKPVIIKQSGSGTKPILSFTGTSGIDTCIKLNQVSYITLEGLQIVDAMATNKVEYGVYFYGSGTVGSQYNTVKNCLIDLDKTNLSSTGVYFYSTGATAYSGANSYNKFYNNTVQDCYSGYKFTGNSPWYDEGNEVNTLSGGTSTINNFGGSTSTAYAVNVSNQKSFVVSNTTISNFTGTPSTGYSTYGIFQDYGTDNTATYSNNSIHDISATQGAFGIFIRQGLTTVLEANDIFNISSVSGYANGINLKEGSTKVVNSNNVHDISGLGGVYGILTDGVTTTTIKRNKIYNIYCTGTGVAYGLSSIGGTTTYIYNNMIYGIEAAASTGAPGVRAVHLSGSPYVYMYYNSVLVDYVSTVASNQSAALYVGTYPYLEMSNNIFVNKSDMTTGTRAVAFYNYSTFIGTLSTKSNNNLFYSGVPGSKNLLFYDGTNSDQTLESFKSRMGGIRENASVTENVPFMSASDLHINPAVGTQIESHGKRITTPLAVTDDFEGVVRQGESGYAGTGTSPDIGAYEGNYKILAVDWANLQWPANLTLKEGNRGSVYAQVYKEGLTEPAGQGAGIAVWIGYSTTNSNPNTWTNWVTASFSSQQGNNDEYVATLGGSLPAGTYYYASRFLLTNADYQYGGFSGGFWNGTTNVSGVLTVENAVITYGNIQFPATATVTESENATIYGRVYAESVTSVAGPSIITCQIGWSSSNSNPDTWSNWSDATYNNQFGNNDEYMASLGSSLAVGTYYYAFRYKLLDDPYFYGGYSATGGGAWDGTTNVSGVLTVSPYLTIVPFIQNFDGVEAFTIPRGWTVLNVNRDFNMWENTFSNPRTAPNSMHIGASWFPDTPMDDWFFSPGVNLTAGVTYELSFWYRGESATFREKLQVFIGNGASADGMASLLFWNNDIRNETYLKATVTIIPATTGVFYFGWYGFSDANQGNMYIDDIMVRVNPSSDNTQTIAAGDLTQFNFIGTGAKVQFTTGNAGSISLLLEKIPGNPGGTLPGALLNLADTYWTGTVTSGTVDGTYDITLDLTGIEGLNVPATIHLVKRNNANGTWTDEGVPDVVNGLLLTWNGLTSFSDFGLAGASDNPLPVELVSFTGKAKNRNVILKWETKTEIDNLGFEVERKDKAGTWMKTAFVEGHGTSNAPKYYNFEDKKLTSGKHLYRLKQIDNDGSFEYSNEVEVTIDVPTEFAMSQNYPNPFNPSTKVDYQLAENARVTIELYGMTGERVAVLMSEEQEAGYYSMMVDAYRHQLASGIYIYRMIATDALGKNFIATKKLSLIK